MAIGVWEKWIANNYISDKLHNNVGVYWKLQVLGKNLKPKFCVCTDWMIRYYIIPPKINRQQYWEQ